ncbi:MULTISPECIES: DMT family transporter [unclassified Herbaspirillum]|jgi:drug/metabolite transporter (DMT)-like permease|uniref:DMT family transporter n=1 Tax=unclassified Herbaspirillum TaxID=2624150 RepID=UPI000E2ECBD1|nr:MULTISPECIES: DMT family transporter [unclassified Herbaspirillum]RFB65711.1 DMT family transporter [Herbaspirillum sp. 3R-3a1]TFI08987.1 DMT family transporter [Herbaspirillum sp. 3R11]TFI15405.1 DMT family transporter [Herbaspirillum sp. 3R-11]TFI31826.1 DMT family transporter [Herbaspirillum sp. 3C11]
MSSTALSPSISPRRAYLAGLLLAVVGAIFFSAKAIVAKLMYRYHVDAVMVISLRMMFSLPMFAVLAIWQARNSPPLAGRDYARIVFLGLIGYYLSSFLDFLGLQYISAGLERLILFLTPSFVLLISFTFYKRKVGLIEWGALLVSYLGTALVLQHDINTGGNNVVLGSVLVLGAAISYALYLIFSGELVRRVGAMRLVAYAMCVSSVACIIQFFVLRPASALVQPVEVYQLSLINAVFCTVLPVCLTMVAVSRIGAPSAAQAGLVGPVSTLFLGAMLLDEPITAIQLTGTALVLSGIYLLSRKKT